MKLPNSTSWNAKNVFLFNHTWPKTNESDYTDPDFNGLTSRLLHSVMNISGNYADHYKAFAFRGGSGSSLISTLINEGTLYD